MRQTKQGLSRFRFPGLKHVARLNVQGSSHGASFGRVAPSPPRPHDNGTPTKTKPPGTGTGHRTSAPSSGATSPLPSSARPPGASFGWTGAGENGDGGGGGDGSTGCEHVEGKKETTCGWMPQILVFYMFFFFFFFFSPGTQGQPGDFCRWFVVVQCGGLIFATLGHHVYSRNNET